MTDEEEEQEETQMGALESFRLDADDDNGDDISKMYDAGWTDVTVLEVSDREERERGVNIASTTRELYTEKCEGGVTIDCTTNEFYIGK